MSTLSVILPSRRGAPTRRLFCSLLTALTLVLSPFIGSAQVAPSLGTAQSFGVLAGSTVTNTGPTVATGDLGVSPGTAVVGFPPGLVVGGAIHAADAVALQAQTDLVTAYNNLAGQACNTTFSVPTDLGGQTLLPGVYCFASSLAITGTLTLDGLGNPNSVFIFQVGSTLITASNSSIVLVNGASPCSDYFQVGSSATLGTDTRFTGNILALTSITAQAGTTVAGRLLARNGAVTLDTNTISPAACSAGANQIPPTLGKAFSPATTGTGVASVLTLTLSNSSTSAAALTAPLIDSLPSGLLISGAATTTCGGIVTAVAGSSAVTLTGGSIPSGGSCTVNVDVTAASAGTYVNSLAAGALITSNGSNSAPAVASLVVTAPAVVPPTVSKAFSPATITAGGVSTLTLTLNNPDPIVPAAITRLLDSLPIGTLVAGSASNTCGGVLTAANGSSTITLTGGVIPASGTCKVILDVSAANAGNYVNSVLTGGLQTSNGSNSAPALATLNVNAITPLSPTLSKLFTPSTIAAGSVSTLVITLNNPDSTIANLTSPLTDTFPQGLVVSGTAVNTCNGVVTAGTSFVRLTGGSIPAHGSCTLTVHVTATASGTYLNTLAANSLQTNHGGNTQGTAANLIVTGNGVGISAPVLSKVFTPSTIFTGQSSHLTLMLNNPNSSIAHLTSSLTDTLPVGLVSSGGATTTCGGSVSAPAGSTKVILTGGSIPAQGSCSVQVNVLSVAAGCFENTIPAGSLKTDLGSNTNTAVAMLNVNVPNPATPYPVKHFNPIGIAPGGTSVLTITLHNPLTVKATLTAPFVDNFPAGLTVNGAASTTCGGGILIGAGGTKVTLTGGSIGPVGICTITVPVTSKIVGTYYNTFGRCSLQTDKGCNKNGYVAAFSVGMRLTKAFSPNTIKVGGGSLLTITLDNPGAGSATMTAPLVDKFPSGLTIGHIVSNSCGGNLSAPSGGSTVTLTGGTIPANGLCSVAVMVTAKLPNCYYNVIPVGALRTTKGINTAPYDASILVF